MRGWVPHPTAYTAGCITTDYRGKEHLHCLPQHLGPWFAMKYQDLGSLMCRFVGMMRFFNSIIYFVRGAGYFSNKHLKKWQYTKILIFTRNCQNMCRIIYIYDTTFVCLKQFGTISIWDKYFFYLGNTNVYLMYFF